jgi:hypothetical protein
MTSKWESISDLKWDYFIIKYPIRGNPGFPLSPSSKRQNGGSNGGSKGGVPLEILFNNNDETITINESFYEITNVEKQVIKYAKDKQLTYQPLPSGSTTFKPFNIVWLREKNGSQKPFSKTIVYTEKVNKEVDIKQIHSIDDFKVIHQIPIENYNELVKMGHWHYKYIVKFALLPKLIVNRETKTLKLNLQCKQLAFEDKDIQYEWKKKFDKPKNPFLEAFLDETDNEGDEEEKKVKVSTPPSEEEMFPEAKGQRPNFITKYYYEKSISRQDPVHPGELMSEFIYFIGNEVTLKPDEYRELCDLMKQLVAEGKISKPYLFYKVLNFSSFCIPEVYNDFRRTLQTESILSPEDIKDLDRQKRSFKR